MRRWSRNRCESDASVSALSTNSWGGAGHGHRDHRLGPHRQNSRASSSRARAPGVDCEFGWSCFFRTGPPTSARARQRWSRQLARGTLLSSPYREKSVWQLPRDILATTSAGLPRPSRRNCARVLRRKRLELPRQLRHDLKEIPDQTVARHFQDQRFWIFVDVPAPITLSSIVA